MRRDYEILVARMNCEIAHGHVRKISAGVLRPLSATIERDPEAELGADKQQVLIDQIFLHDMRVTAHIAYRRNYLCPCLPIVHCPVNVRTHVAEGVRIDGGVGRSEEY